MPAAAPGALTVGDETAHALWRTGKVAFVDVMPDFPKPKGLPKDAIWQGRVRYSVPGAHWMPEAGYGDLAAEAETAFKTDLTRITGGDLDHPILFLCRQDCWMSWNASKRAAGWGYTRVFWYPDGSTGWEFWDWPMERMRRAKD